MKFWNRQIRLIVAGQEYSSEQIDIEFDVPFTTEKEPDVAEIRIYNLSDMSVGTILSRQDIFLNAGYGSDIGNIFTGKIESVDTHWQGVDKITTILATDSGVGVKNNQISRTYKAGTKASFIMRDIAKVLGVKVVEINPANDIEYPKGKTVKGNSYSVLTQLAKETNSKMYVLKGQLYIRASNKGTETGFTLNYKSGLISSPERIEEEETEGEKTKKIIKYRITCLLNHKITKDSLIRVESRTLNGQFRVLEGKHTSDFNTELIVKP